MIWNPGSKLLKFKYWNMQQCFIVFFTVLNIKLHQFLNKHLTEDSFKIKWGVTRKGIPVIKTRWSYSHLILIMGIPIPEKLVLLLKQMEDACANHDYLYATRIHWNKLHPGNYLIIIGGVKSCPYDSLYNEVSRTCTTFLNAISRMKSFVSSLKRLDAEFVTSHYRNQ